MYKNYLYSDERGEVEVGIVVPSDVGQLPFYDLTMAANSAKRQNEKQCWHLRHRSGRGSKKIMIFFFFFLLPSAPILPSPSVSPALRKALVSASFRTRAPDLKFCRNSLQKESVVSSRTQASHWLRHAMWLQRVQFGWGSTEARDLTYFFSNIDIDM